MGFGKWPVPSANGAIVSGAVVRPIVKPTIALSTYIGNLERGAGLGRADRHRALADEVTEAKMAF